MSQGAFLMTLILSDHFSDSGRWPAVMVIPGHHHLGVILGPRLTTAGLHAIRPVPFRNPPLT
jgi:hypothetical protein